MLVYFPNICSNELLKYTLFTHTKSVMLFMGFDIFELNFREKLEVQFLGEKSVLPEETLGKITRKNSFGTKYHLLFHPWREFFK